MPDYPIARPGVPSFIEPPRPADYKLPSQYAEAFQSWLGTLRDQFALPENDPHYYGTYKTLTILNGAVREYASVLAEITAEQENRRYRRIPAGSKPNPDRLALIKDHDENMGFMSRVRSAADSLTESYRNRLRRETERDNKKG